MKRVSANNFGLLIAYLVPGFTALWGASFLSPTLHAWLTGPAASGPTVGGFLYVTIASIAAGMTVSTLRWLLIDTIHHRTGLPKPEWDFSGLQANVDAYDVLTENHYKFYQHAANMVIALLIVWIARRLDLGFFTAALDRFDAGILLLTVIYFAGSRDTLKRYYGRLDQLLKSS